MELSAIIAVFYFVTANIVFSLFWLLIIVIILCPLSIINSFFELLQNQFPPNITEIFSRMAHYQNYSNGSAQLNKMAARAKNRKKKNL